MRPDNITINVLNSLSPDLELAEHPRYLEFKPSPLAFVFQSFTIGHLELSAISNCFLFPLSVRDSGIQLYLQNPSATVKLINSLEFKNNYLQG